MSGLTLLLLSCAEGGAPSVNLQAIPETSFEACSADDPSLGSVPLLKAAATGDTREIELLVDDGADLNQKFKFKYASHEMERTALICAVETGQHEAVKSLLENGADPNAGNHVGTTPLGFAVVERETSMVETLLEAGADPNISNHVGWTPLGYAALIPEGLEIFERLMGSPQTELEAAKASNKPLLQYLAESGRIELVRRLLDAGADADRVDMKFVFDEEIRTLLEAHRDGRVAAPTS